MLIWRAVALKVLGDLFTHARQNTSREIISCDLKLLLEML